MVGLPVLAVVHLPSVGFVVCLALGVTVPYKLDKAASRPICPVVGVEELVLACTLGGSEGTGTRGTLPASPCTAAGVGGSGTTVVFVGAVVVG